MHPNSKHTSWSRMSSNTRSSFSCAKNSDRSVMTSLGACMTRVTMLWAHTHARRCSLRPYVRVNVSTHTPSGHKSIICCSFFCTFAAKPDFLLGQSRREVQKIFISIVDVHPVCTARRVSCCSVRTEDTSERHYERTRSVCTSWILDIRYEMCGTQ